MEFFSLLQSSLLSAWGEVWMSFLSILPSVLGAIIVFAIGIAIAYWVKRLIVGLLKLVKLERLTSAAGIEKYLQKAEIKFSFSELVGTVFEWIIILIFFLAVVDILGLPAVSQVVASVLGYIPNIVAAALILGAGFVLGGMVDGLVRGALASFDGSVARSVGKLSRYVVIIFAFFAGLDQLKIAQGLVITFYQGLTYTVVLVVGLAVGLGSKDLVAKMLGEWYDKIRR
jgi:hypothetical protein